MTVSYPCILLNHSALKRSGFTFHVQVNFGVLIFTISKFTDYGSL